MTTPRVVHRPYKLLRMPLKNANLEQLAYVFHPDYAENPVHYNAALHLLYSDLAEQFKYVAPADDNSRAYSLRIHELFVRCCIEIEAHFQNIIVANVPNVNVKSLSIEDYWCIETTHVLSGYEVRYPGWTGNNHIRKPFLSWATGKKAPCWWREYQLVKHRRHTAFAKANLTNLMDAFSGLLVIYHAQFGSQNFSPRPPSLITSRGYSYGDDDGMETAAVSAFRIKEPAPASYPIHYEFNWSSLKTEKAPIERYEYSVPLLKE